MIKGSFVCQLDCFLQFKCTEEVLWIEGQTSSKEKKNSPVDTENYIG